MAELPDAQLRLLARLCRPLDQRLVLLLNLLDLPLELGRQFTPILVGLHGPRRHVEEGQGGDADQPDQNLVPNAHATAPGVSLNLDDNWRRGGRQGSARLPKLRSRQRFSPPRSRPPNGTSNRVGEHRGTSLPTVCPGWPNHAADMAVAHRG